MVRDDRTATLSPFGIVNVLSRQFGIHPRDIRRGSHIAPALVRARRAIARSMKGLGWDRMVIAEAMGRTASTVSRWTSDTQQQVAADRYADRVARGVCVRCGGRPPRARQRLCGRCREKNTQEMHDRAARRTAGRRNCCSICGKPGFNAKTHDLHSEKRLHVERPDLP